MVISRMAMSAIYAEAVVRRWCIFDAYRGADE